jgi:aspartate kinase
MKVFKFGGASISSYDRILNLATILEDHKDEKILIVISAVGKMTNALETVVDAFMDERNEDALKLFQKIKEHHLDMLKYIITVQWEKATRNLNDFFTEVEWLLHDKPVKGYDYYYDQIVCCGELLSSTLISYFLEEKKIPNKWIDVRDLLRTDHHFRDGKVDWDYTGRNVTAHLLPLFEKTNFVITQGFIASTDENESTTLGREGSDYTAAIFAELLRAESVTIWKDVDGIMNADPKDFKDAIVIHELSYKEIIEMAYYGAQVVHPKTIKPLQNRNIPLYVKSFLDARLPGTVITQKSNRHLPSIIVYKRQQALITLQTQDFSFVEGQPANFLLKITEEARVKPNLTQNAAISLMICIDDTNEKTGQIALQASSLFDVQIQKDLTLLTIRHHTPDTVRRLTTGKEIVLQQITPDTIQILIKEDQPIT